MSEKPTETPTRNNKGQFVKGQSGNASGQPKAPIKTDASGNPLEGPDLYRANHDVVFAELYRVITHKKTPAGPRVTAIREFMDRGFGKPQNSVLLRRGEDETALDVQHLPDHVLRDFIDKVHAAQAKQIEDNSGDA